MTNNEFMYNTLEFMRLSWVIFTTSLVTYTPMF